MSTNTQAELATEVRQDLILQRVNADGAVSVAALAETFGVSPSSIRRDLETLERLGALRRTHGGAAPIAGGLREMPFAHKSQENPEGKRWAAKQAAALVTPGDILFIDGGSTCLLLAREVRSIRQITVVTNSVPAAYELLGCEHISLIVIGGQVRHLSASIVGSFAQTVLGSLNIDKAFLGADAVDADGFYTINDPDDQVKRLVLDRSRQAFLVVDRTKLGRKSVMKTATLERLAGIIVDEVPDEGLRAEMEAKVGNFVSRETGH